MNRFFLLVSFATIVLSTNLFAQGEVNVVDIPNLNEYRDSHTLIGIQGYGLLAIGGHNGDSATSTCELFSLDNNEWHFVESMPEPRMLHSSHGNFYTDSFDHDPLISHESVIVIGGNNDSTTLTSILSFDVENELWYEVANMSVARADHKSILTQENQIIITGGTDGVQAVSSVEVFNLLDSSVSTLPSMNFARYGHSMNLLSDSSIMVAGGLGVNDEPLNSVEIYHPSLNEWVEITSLNESRAYHASISPINVDCETGPGGTCGVLIHGGINDSQTLSSAEYYCPCNEEWTTLQLPFSSAFHHLFFNSDPYWNNTVYSSGGVDVSELSIYQSNAFSLWAIYLVMEGVVYFEDEIELLSTAGGEEVEGRYRSAVAKLGGVTYCVGGDLGGIGTCWKTDDSSGMEEESYDVFFFPNPVIDELQIKSNQQHWIITNIMGSTIKQGTDNIIVVSELIPGLYQINLSNGKSAKFIKI